MIGADCNEGSLKNSYRERQSNSWRGDCTYEMSDVQERNPAKSSTEFNGSCSSRSSKVKFEALRSYTFDLVDGPILNMRRWIRSSHLAESERSGETPAARNSTSATTPSRLPTPKRFSSNLPRETTAGTVAMEDEGDVDSTRNRCHQTAFGTREVSIGQASFDEDDLVNRDMMMRYMNRMKNGLCVIKLTFGPTWMHIWRLNDYGFALNARMNIEPIIQAHVETVVATNSASTVVHQRGHAVHDPTTANIPLWQFRDNMLRRNESVLGDAGGQHRRPSGHAESKVSNRQRSVSDAHTYREHPVVLSSGNAVIHDDQVSRRSPLLETRQNGHRHRSQTMPSEFQFSDSTVLAQADSPQTVMSPLPHTTLFHSPKQTTADALPGAKAPSGIERDKLPEAGTSLLEHILQQEVEDGYGVSLVVATELSILLWMMMDAGNGWTSMALTLLASDAEACNLVQEEIELLELEFGSKALFTPSILGKMTFLDALLYEAIRLCPAFLGGMKKTSATVDLPDVGVQVPKNSNVFFCQPTDGKFNIRAALGKKPERLGEQYPCLEL
jgi:hypothetical protein